jgi:hypothetical protein
MRRSAYQKLATTMMLSTILFFCGGPFSKADTDATKPIIGRITVCYYTANCSFAIATSKVLNAKPHTDTDSDHVNTPAVLKSAVVDAPAFQITNTGKYPITSARLTIAANAKLSVARDSFAIGKILPGKSFVVIPGLSNDNRTHATTSLFYHSGSALDTSDSGPDDDAIIFQFTGLIGKQVVSTGNIVTGATAGPSNDKTVAKLNFLGGPGNADGPCNDCFGPRLIGRIR